MTRRELKDEIKESIKDSKSFDDIIENVSEYIVNNFKLKRRVIVYGKDKNSKSKSKR